MKGFAKKTTVFLVVALIGGLLLRNTAPIVALAQKATALSASVLLFSGKAEPASAKTPDTVTSQPNQTKFKETAKKETVASSTVPKPPKGEATGTIETTTLSLSAANTKTGGVHVSNRTGRSVDVNEYLSQGMPFSLKDTSQPQVLIVHTHATESYTDGDYGYYLKSASTRSTDNTKNTVAVGEVMAQVLNEAGIVTINDATQHDYPNYTGGYVRSAQTIQTYLEKYPTIKVVLDVHRDAIAKDDNTKLKPTAEINGKKAAQIMILAGCETDSVEDFPNWEENFRFCLQLQKQMEADYPGLARPMSFKACKYNFHLLSGSILLEM